MRELETPRQLRDCMIHCTRQHARATAGAVTLLALCGGWWATAGLAALPGLPRWPVVVIAILTLALGAGGLWAAAQAQRILMLTMALRDLWRNTAIVLSVLALGCVLAGVLIPRSGAAEAIALAVTLLVGLHLLPLARLFHLPVLQRAGLWIIALGLSTWAFVPATLPVGTATVALWPLVTGIGGAGILWAAAGRSLWHLMGLLRAAR